MKSLIVCVSRLDAEEVKHDLNSLTERLEELKNVRDKAVRDKFKDFCDVRFQSSRHLFLP